MPSMLDQLSSPAQSAVPGAGAPSAPTSSPTPAQNNIDGLVRPQGAGPQQMGQQRPPMTHEQASAVIAHFQAFMKEFRPIESDPDLGKKNLRPKIFNAMSALMGDGFITLPMAMNEIKTLPTDPFGQKKWVMTHVANTQQAQRQVINDHRSEVPGTGDYQSDAANFTPGNGNRVHADVMSEIARNYKGG